MNDDDDDWRRTEFGAPTQKIGMMMMRANPYVRFVRDTIDATTGRGDDASIVVSRFVHALGALKYAFIPPETKAGMFPLMMPVGISPEDGNAIGFLLEPSSVNEEEKITLGPIVKAKPNQKQIEFIAKDATTFVRRVLLAVSYTHLTLPTN